MTCASTTGTFQAWRGTAVGEGSASIQEILQKEYENELPMAAAWPIVRQAMKDHARGARGVQMASLTREEGQDVSWHIYSPQDIQAAFGFDDNNKNNNQEQ